MLRARRRWLAVRDDDLACRPSFTGSLITSVTASISQNVVKPANLVVSFKLQATRSVFASTSVMGSCEQRELTKGGLLLLFLFNKMVASSRWESCANGCLMFLLEHKSDTRRLSYAITAHRLPRNKEGELRCRSTSKA